MLANLTLGTLAEKESDRSFKVAEEEPMPPKDIVAYNELRSCADLYRLYKTGKLELYPDFQREVVWNQDERSKFIDSLVKQLPIPSLCLSLDYKTQKWMVIDGLQRMNSIVSFLGEETFIIKNLQDIHPNLRGVTNVELRKGSDENKRLYSKVEDVSLPITVLRCDYSQSTHMQYLFTIFHRLNSGGRTLNNQEIRNCIFSGPFNDLLKKFDRNNDDWKSVKRRIWGGSQRFRSVELLVRALAFSGAIDGYSGDLSKYLNSFMHANRYLNKQELETIEGRLELMSRSANLAIEVPKISKISLTYIEAALVGILNNLDDVVEVSGVELRQRFDNMRSDKEFQKTTQFRLSSTENVKNRIKLASHAFARGRDG